MWSNKIYVATTSLGVYYTNNFTDPATQPVWTAINTGLGSLGCREFWLDPFEPDNRQYVLIGTTGGLYMRVNKGSWATILTLAEAAALVTAAGYPAGANTRMVSFCVDSTIQGRLWCFIAQASVTLYPRGYFALYTDNYGGSWTVTVAYASHSTYDAYSIRAQGNTVFLTANAFAGSYQVIFYSSNKGTSWSNKGLGSGGPDPHVGFNNLLPDRIYLTVDFTGWNGLAKITNAGAQTNLWSSVRMARDDNMWFSLVDANHQRYVIWGYLYVTNNEWSTKSTAGLISPVPISIAPQAGADEDSMFVGLTLGTHIIGCLTNEADTTATGIAGANAGSSPYTDSIPNTCGGLASMGIQAVPITTTIHSYKVAFA